MNLKNKMIEAKNKAVSAAVKAKDTVVDAVMEHPAEIIVGAIGVAMIVIPGVHIARCLSANAAFSKSVQEIYGPNVREGNLLGGNPAKLWGMRENWEEVGKPNFDKVKGLVGELNLAPGEVLELSKISLDKYKGKTEVFQMLDGGFFHDEII